MARIRFQALPRSVEFALQALATTESIRSAERSPAERHGPVEWSEHPLQTCQSASPCLQQSVPSRCPRRLQSLHSDRRGADKAGRCDRFADVSAQPPRELGCFLGGCPSHWSACLL